MINRIQLRQPFGPSSLLIDGERVELANSTALRNHSPTGFSWGYGGSGPAQTALAILLHVTQDADVAQRWYQTFKSEVIAVLDQSCSHELELDVAGWIKEQALPSSA